MSWLAPMVRTARQAVRGSAGRALLAALLLAVVAVTSVSLLGARIGTLMQDSAQDLLGADLVLVGAAPLPPEWAEEAQRRGLRLARQQIFPSMVFGAEQGQLAEVKAVSAGHPLRGSILTATTADGPAEAQERGPSVGSVWLAADLARTLGVKVGEQVDLGDRSLTVAALLLREPDRSGGVFSFAPRLLMQLEDLKGSGLDAAGSRISERLLLAGAAAELREFEDWLKPQLEGRARLQTLADSQQTLTQALERALAFLRLAVLCAVLLAGVALLLSARRYAELEQPAVALLKTLGWTGGQLLRRYAAGLSLLALVTGAVGALLAVLIERLAVHLLDIAELQAVAAPGLGPAWVGIVLGLALLLACVLPSVLVLSRVPPVAVLKQEPEALPQSRLLSLLPPLLLLWLLAWLATSDARLSAVALGGLLVGLAAVAGMAWLMLRLLPKTARSTWRLGLNKYRHAPMLGVVQISALAAGFAALALIGVLSRDLLNTWKLSLDADTPNYFLINARTEQLDALRKGLRDAGAVRLTDAPVAIARLRAINEVAVEQLRRTDLRARDRLERNQNLSWAAQPGVGNTLVAGQWFRDDGIAEISAATSWAEPLGVKVGDWLDLSVGERRLRVQVSSLREVAWDSFAVNFFLVIEPSAAAGLAHSQLLSFHLPGDRRAALDPLLREYSNLSLMDIESMLREVRLLIDRASLAVRLVFGFSVIAGLLVLLAAFSATLDERMREAAILRALGASGAQIRGTVLTEFGAIGLAAGLLAAGLALAVGSLLAQRIFDLPLQADYLALGLVVAAAVGLALLLGAIASERLLRTRALDALRRV